MTRGRFFDENEGKARVAFLAFLEEDECSREIPEWRLSEGGRMRDAQAIELIATFGHLRDCTQAVHMNKDDRDEMIRQCRKRGCSVRQIAPDGGQ